MACVFKRGRRYSCRLRINGRDVWRSLETTNREDALRKAAELEGSAKGRQWVRRQFDELTARAEREVHPDEASLLCDGLAANLRRLLNLVSDEDRDALTTALSRRLMETQADKVPISEGWDRWIASPRRATRPKATTINSYCGIWRRFAAWAEANGQRWFHELDERSAIKYAGDLWASSMTPRTFNVHVWFLKNVWTVLRVEAGLGKENPWSSIPPKAGSHQGSRRPLTEAEVVRVVASATGALRLLLVAGAQTGARLGDVVSMRWDHLDLEAGIWRLTPMKTARLGKSQEAPILEPLLGELRKWKCTEAGLRPFVFGEERTAWQRHELNKAISAHFEACGIATNRKVEDGENRRRAKIVVGFHSLRHFVATNAAKNGMNLGLVQKVLGHSNEAMTHHYTHGDLESARSVLSPMARIVSGAFTTAATAKSEGGEHARA